MVPMLTVACGDVEKRQRRRARAGKQETSETAGRAQALRSVRGRGEEGEMSRKEVDMVKLVGELRE